MDTEFPDIFYIAYKGQVRESQRTQCATIRQYQYMNTEIIAV